VIEAIVVVSYLDSQVESEGLSGDFAVVCLLLAFLDVIFMAAVVQQLTKFQLNSACAVYQQ